MLLSTQTQYKYIFICTSGHQTQHTTFGSKCYPRMRGFPSKQILPAVAAVQPRDGERFLLFISSGSDAACAKRGRLGMPYARSS
jgi:hypothetical protein